MKYLLLTIFSVLAAGFITFFGVDYLTKWQLGALPNQEITDVEYQTLTYDLVEPLEPEFQLAVKALADGQVTNAEYENIRAINKHRQAAEARQQKNALKRAFGPGGPMRNVDIR